MKGREAETSRDHRVNIWMLFSASSLKREHYANCVNIHINQPLGLDACFLFWQSRVIPAPYPWTVSWKSRCLKFWGSIEKMFPFFSTFFLFLCVCMHVSDVFVWMHVAQHTGIGQKMTLWSQFSPILFIWILGIKLKSPGLCSKCLYLLSHLTTSTFRFLKHLSK